jgi:hypothetical protein
MKPRLTTGKSQYLAANIPPIGRLPRRLQSTQRGPFLIRKIDELLQIGIVPCPG